MSDHVERIKTLFGGDNFKFARWAGPIAPAVIGLDERGAKLFGEAVRALAEAAGHPMAAEEPQSGEGFHIYVMKSWADAARMPGLPDFLPELPALISRLTQAQANCYRVFAFDDQGAIRSAITMLCYDERMQAAPVDYIALTEAALGMMVYDEAGVSEDRPVAMADFGDGDQRAVLQPWHAQLLRAAYDPSIPAGSKDPALALRLAARISVAADDDDADDYGDDDDA